MIRAEHIFKSYDNLAILTDVNFSVEKGEVVAIVGPSGAGKSTLLQIIGSLEKPDSGKIYFDDTDVLSLSQSRLAAFRNRMVGFVFQFHQLLPEFSMLENVAMPALIGGENHNKAFARAKEIIGYFGLSNRLDHRPSELSGGERQRAAVARSLINNPQVVLADEPSGSLDSANRRELHKLFFDLRRDFGQTFVIVTHDESLAADTDRVFHMTDGRITDMTKGGESA